MGTNDYTTDRYAGAWLPYFGRLLGSWGLLLAVVWSCAEPSMPAGGPKDTRPPMLHKKRYSTPNGSLNYPYQRVILTFDEWVRLKNASTQVVISPPLRDRPLITVRNKSVVVSWKEPLKDSTTYVIQFGESVSDLTEGNVVPNLKLVFSTGPYLDSLTCKGQVLLADTREPAADTWVMLYRDLADSMPLTQKPYYFTQTDAGGNFKLDYLRGGRYRVFALQEKGNDYRYNNPQEKIGFLDTSFVINDTLQPYFRLLLFKERAPLRIVATDLEGYGRARFTFNEALVEPITWSWVGPPPASVRVEQGGDSLRLWYDDGPRDTEERQLILEHVPSDWRDTIALSTQARTRLLEECSPLRWYLPRKNADQESAGVGKRKGKSQQQESAYRPAIDTLPVVQHPLETLKLYFNQPINSWDSSKMQWSIDTTMMVERLVLVPVLDTLTGDTLSLDSTQVEVAVDTFTPIALPQVMQDEQQGGALRLQAAFIPNRRYQLQFLPGAVVGFFGRLNTDTLVRIYTIAPIDNYGSLTLKIVNADSTQQYLIEVLSEKGQLVRQTMRSDSSAYTLIYPYLPTERYQYRVSTDLNRNGRWDVGEYATLRQPEPRTIVTPSALQPGWENEFQLDLDPEASPVGGKGKKGTQGAPPSPNGPPAEGEKPPKRSPKKGKVR